MISYVENETNVATAVVGKLLVGVVGDVVAINNDVSFRYRVQTANQVEQGGFARAGLANHKHQTVVLQGQIDVVQRLVLALFLGVVNFCDVFDFYHLAPRFRKNLRLLG